jgi:putative transposase
MRYAFIAKHAGQYGVERMCRLLGVARSGYYAWKYQVPSPHSQANAGLLEEIRSEFAASGRTYGSPRLHLALVGRAIPCGRHRVARLMRRDGLQARARRKAKPVTTHRQAGVVPAPNLLNRDFSASAPNQKWVCDFTAIATEQGWLYLAVVLDLFSRKVIGWAMNARMDTALVEAALHMALRDRQPGPGLLHHSDQGSQYTAAAYLDCLRAAQSRISMSRVGNCYDNAAMESFFSTLKMECATVPFGSQGQARRVISDYMEVWYNQHRLHSSLGYCSPVDFEFKFSL